MFTAGNVTPPLCLSGGITQEAEFAGVKFVKSPYSLSLVSTPPFIKPGLPYNIQVSVRKPHFTAVKTRSAAKPGGKMEGC